MSPYRAPVLFVHEKEPTLRMSINFWALNKQTKLDAYPIPKIDDILDRLKAAQWFSKIDLSTRYH